MRESAPRNSHDVLTQAAVESDQPELGVAGEREQSGRIACPDHVKKKQYPSARKAFVKCWENTTKKVNLRQWGKDAGVSKNAPEEMRGGNWLTGDVYDKVTARYGLDWDEWIDVPPERWWHQWVHLILEFAGNIVAIRSGKQEGEVRAWCHLIDKDRNRLIPIKPYMGKYGRISKDADLGVSCKRHSNYIIVQCYLNPGERPIYGRATIDPKTPAMKDLNAVAALAIVAARDGGSECLGTVSFDAPFDLKDLQWSSENIDLEVTLRTLGDMISQLPESYLDLYKRRRNP
jgi:hypothetical protein